MNAVTKAPADLLKPGQPLTLSQVADGAEGLVLSRPRPRHRRG